MRSWRLTATALCFGAACTSSPVPPQRPRDTVPDGGIVLEVPDAGTACGGAALNGGGVGDTTAGAAEAGAPPDCQPTAVRDYETEVRPVLASCHGEVCHGGAFLVTSQLMQLVSAPAAECCGRRRLIVPGHPEQSYVIDKVIGQNLCDGNRMPLGGPYLSPAQVQILSDWICEGAPF